MKNKTKKTKSTTKSKVAKSKDKGTIDDVLKSKKEPIKEPIVDESLKSKEEPIRKTLVIDNVVEDNLSTNVVESKKVKSKIIVKAPKGLVTPKKVVIQKVEFPEFADILEMKEFCVLCGLNKVDGYILATKRKKIEFLSWMSENFHKAELPTSITSISNPFSPSAGIGEMQTSNEGNIKAALSILRKPEVANNTIELP